MRIVFRADASTKIGAGHIMRCATLAEVLRARGHQVSFICRQLRGDMIAYLRQQDFDVASLAPDAIDDAEASGRALQSVRPDWLIVDHYGLGIDWELALLPKVRQIMVIDDLANRPHAANVLLDQNLTGNFSTRYDALVDLACIKLLGPDYALVRPEFTELRPQSLARRATAGTHNLLIFMGGGDVFNATAIALAGAVRADGWNKIDVVVGSGCPQTRELEAKISAQPGAKLHIQSPHMAQLMSAADFAITGGGSVSWEKCTLGLPSIVAIMADNQAPIAQALHDQGAQHVLGLVDALEADDYAREMIKFDAIRRQKMGHNAAQICNGQGASQVVAELERKPQ